MKKRNITKILPSEHQLQTLIINYLFIKGYYAMRLNSGKIPMEGKRGRRLIQMLPAGTPDIMAFKSPRVVIFDPARKYCELLFIEVKRPGNKPTILQQTKMKELEESGARCFVASSIEDVDKYLAS